MTCLRESSKNRLKIDGSILLEPRQSESRFLRSQKKGGHKEGREGRSFVLLAGNNDFHKLYSRDLEAGTTIQCRATSRRKDRNHDASCNRNNGFEYGEEIMYLNLQYDMPVQTKSSVL
jgi:hypothetical protein